MASRARVANLDLKENVVLLAPVVPMATVDLLVTVDFVAPRAMKVNADLLDL